MTEDTTTTTTAAAPEAPTPAEAALAAALRAVDEAKALVAQERAERVRTAKIDRINQKVEAQLAALQTRIDALLARKAQMEARRIVTSEAQPQEAQAQAPAARTTRQAGSADQAWKRSVPYQFWVSYQKAHRNAAHTQKLLSATCKAHNVDQADRSAANLQKVHAILSAQGQAS